MNKTPTILRLSPVRSNRFPTALAFPVFCWDAGEAGTEISGRWSRHTILTGLPFTLAKPVFQQANRFVDCPRPQTSVTARLAGAVQT